MKLMTTLLSATALVAAFAGAAEAKTLVYCSEASPANFDPGTTTGGNDFDASSRTIYHRASSSSSMAAPRSSPASPRAGKFPLMA